MSRRSSRAASHVLKKSIEGTDWWRRRSSRSNSSENKIVLLESEHAETICRRCKKGGREGGRDRGREREVVDIYGVFGGWDRIKKKRVTRAVGIKIGGGDRDKRGMPDEI